MKKILLITSLLLLASSCAENKTQKKEKIKTIKLDNNKLQFEEPPGFKEVEKELEKAMFDFNDAIIFVSFYDTIPTNEMFIVSKYVAGSKSTIQDAFIESINTKTNGDIGDLKDNFQLIEAKTYQVNGKTLRLKISHHYNEFYSIMYYFMKDGYSNELYELKFCALDANFKRVKNLAEKIAVSVELK